MATVSTPASMSSVISVFGGPGNLTAYYRGGTYVPINSTAAISTTAASLALSQFNGAQPGVVSAVATPSSVSGSSSGNTQTGSVTSGSTTVSWSGDQSATCAWSYVSGYSSMTVGSPSSKTTNFSAPLTATQGNGNTVTAVYKCTITGAIASNSVNVNVSLTYNHL